MAASAKRLAVLTTGRHDWGILQLLVETLKSHGCSILVFREEGHTVKTASVVYDRLRETFSVDHPDALIVLGDRYEMMMGVLAATVCKVPVIHLHGGEITEGAFDNQIRYAVSRMAHLHLVASADAKMRLEASGERSVVLAGAIGTDWAFRVDLSSREDLEVKLKVRLKDPVMLVSVHPETLGHEGVERKAIELGRANPGTTVYFLPNLDPGHEDVRDAITKAPRAGDALVSVLPPKDYWGLMCLADSFVGNSSSIVLEAPAAGLKTVLLGERQKGRVPPMKPDGKAAERAARAILAWHPTLHKELAQRVG